MARGAIAKEEVIRKIADAFGESFIGEVDKKIYLWANDGGERVQIALALTCPKTFVEGGACAKTKPVSDSAFDMPSAEPQRAEITPEEQENLATLIARLGL